MTMVICEHFHIAASHPALPGHFPDDPVVPGVVLLERVAAAVEREFGAHITGLPQVKFLHPLRAEESVELRMEHRGKAATFSLWRGQDAIATGLLELAP